MYIVCTEAFKFELHSYALDHGLLPTSCDLVCKHVTSASVRLESETTPVPPALSLPAMIRSTQSFTNILVKNDGPHLAAET